MVLRGYIERIKQLKSRLPASVIPLVKTGLITWGILAVTDAKFRYVARLVCPTLADINSPNFFAYLAYSYVVKAVIIYSVITLGIFIGIKSTVERRRSLGLNFLALFFSGSIVIFTHFTFSALISFFNIFTSEGQLYISKTTQFMQVFARGSIGLSVGIAISFIISGIYWLIEKNKSKPIQMVE